jgi:hypothetical protein
MKTAFELAMERMGGVKTYSEEQKKKLAEIDRIFDAEAAQAKFRADDRLKKAGDETTDEGKAKADQARSELADELARIERKREKKKEEVRAQK